MSNEQKNALTSPDSFPFPFEPYPIQVDFMTALYEAIEMKKIGVFESPTGTGKSLSLICGSLKWLFDHEARIKKEIEETLSSKSEIVKHSSLLTGKDEPSWIQEFAEKQIFDERIKKAKSIKERRERRENQLKKLRFSNGSIHQCKREKYLKRKHSTDEDETIRLMEQAKKEMDCLQSTSQDEIEKSDDAEFALDDYESEDDKKEEIDEDDENYLTKVFFCSRTHSQLSQFIHELQKSPYGKPADLVDVPPITVATLASRNSLCINESVRKLGSVHQMNEKCLEMQKNSAKKKENVDPGKEPKKRKRDKKCKKTCCYYGNQGVLRLTDKIVANILDVEDLVKDGKEMEACPYYAARHALPYCQLVVLPYQTLLHESTRLASGINIRDSVIIIDEAHNLVEAINSMYSCQISAKQLARTLSQLIQYSQKFSKRLKAKNLYYVKQLIYVIRNLLSSMTSNSSTTTAVSDPKALKCETEPKLHTLTEFLFSCNLDNINFHKLLRYCTRSKISVKLNGFFEKHEVSVNTVKPKSVLTNFLEEIKTTAAVDDTAQRNNDAIVQSPLRLIESFLLSLTSSLSDGRVVVTTGSQPSLKFLLLNPAVHFKKILNQCRSLIVAGGTMQPSSCMIDQLIPRTEQTDYQSRIVEFSCGHVIDGAKQLLPIALSSGPSGETFQFTYEKRNSTKLICDLGRMLINIFNVVPGGVVCFFPSYDYENYVYQRWKEEGIIAKLGIRKKVFREPKNSSECVKVLTDYSTCIERSRKSMGKVNGSLLLCVVGGKMSEGINFSDDLGRCVVIVGLPYPNLHSPELKEKISYLNKNLPRHSDGRSAGQVHYESLCMKAVNQSIGRAIRHRKDFACLLLVDQRYGKPSVANKLPTWIAQHLKTSDKFGVAFSAIRKFFNEKRTEESDK